MKTSQNETTPLHIMYSVSLTYKNWKTTAYVNTYAYPADLARRPT